jgi:hypothetical protein
MRLIPRTARIRFLRSSLADSYFMSESSSLSLAQSSGRRHLRLSRAGDIHKFFEGHWALFYNGRGWRQAHMRVTRQGLKVGMFKTTRQLSLFRSKAAKKKAAKAAKKKTSKPRVVKRGRQKGPAMDLSTSLIANKRRASLRKLESMAIANSKKRLGL